MRTLRKLAGLVEQELSDGVVFSQADCPVVSVGSFSSFSQLEVMLNRVPTVDSRKAHLRPRIPVCAVCDFAGHTANIQDTICQLKNRPRDTTIAIRP